MNTNYFYRENDNVYLNVVMQNHKYLNNGILDGNMMIAEYDVTKTTPIIDKASDYYCSIIRFDVPLEGVPIYVIPIVPNQPNSNLTQMIIGVTYLGVDYPVNIIYSPDNNYTPPIQDKPDFQVITPYYYVYTFENLIKSINEALNQSIMNSGFTLPSNISNPYFYMNDGVISFIVPDQFCDITVNPNRPLIFMNSILETYLEAIRVRFIGFNQPNGHDFEFLLDGIGLPTYNQACDVCGNSVASSSLIPPARSSYWKITQEYNVLNYWTSLRKLILSTNTIPIANEFVPAQNNDSGINNSFPIITDFVPSIDTPSQSRSVAYYTPTSQYRLVDMINDGPLFKINLKIYWEDKLGNIYPLNIPAGQQVNVKIAFLRKTLYKHSNLLMYK